MVNFIEFTSDCVCIDVPEDGAKGVEGKTVGLWNGRVVQKLTGVLKDIEPLTHKVGRPWRVSTVSTESISPDGSAAIGAGFVALGVFSLCAVRYRSQSAMAPSEALGLNILGGLCMLFGIGCLGVSWYKGRRINQQIEMRNGEVAEKIEWIKEEIDFFKGLSPDLPADTGSLEKLLGIFKELEIFSSGWQSIIFDDRSSEELSESFERDQNSIYSELSYKQLLDLLSMLDIDEETKKWLKEQHPDKESIVQILFSASSSSLSSSQVATFIRLYGKDTFISEPEVFREYLQQLPEEITASSEVKTVVEYIQNQIELTTNRSLVPGAVAEALPHNSDFVVVVRGERIAISTKVLLSCDVLEARVRLEANSSMWSNTVKMEEELPEMPIELPEGMELETFKQMLQCLPTGRIAEGVPNLEALLDCANYFGAIPIIEEVQWALLRKLNKNVDGLGSMDLEEALGEILSKSSSSTKVQDGASDVFKKVIFSAAKNKSWERVESLLKFAKSYSAFNMCLERMEFDLSETGLLPVHVKLAFDFNLVEFQKRIKELFALKIQNEPKISLILAKYSVSTDAKSVLQEILRQYIRKDVFRDVWEYAEKTEDLDLKKICLDYLKAHSSDLTSIWRPFEIPQEIAKCLSGPILWF